MEGSTKRLYYFALIALIGLIVAYLVRRYLSSSPSMISIESLSLTQAQLDLLAELGLDRSRLSALLSTFNASKVFLSSSIDSLFDSFLELMNTNKEAAANLYKVAVAHAEQYKLAGSLLSATLPKQAAKLKRVLREAGSSTIKNVKVTGEEAVKEWRKFVKESPQGKAVGVWAKQVKEEYRSVLHAASTAMPQRVVEWCERAINQLLE